MKKIIFLTTILISFFSFLYGQGDDCSSAIQLTSLSDYCSTGGQYTNTTATAPPAGSFAQASCWSNASQNIDVWFKFVCVGTDAMITVKGLGSSTGANLKEASIALYSGDCASTLVEHKCAQSTTTSNITSIYQGAMVLAKTYYIRVTTTSTNKGKFDLCINNFNPVQNPNSPNDCDKGTIICNKDAVSIGLLDSYGSNTTEHQLTGSCMESSTEANSTWLKFKCSQSGTLDFELQGTDINNDLDWILMEIPALNNCATKTLISCNVASCNINGTRFDGIERKTGLRSGEDAASLNDVFSDVFADSEPSSCVSPSNGYNQSADLVVGKTYALFINNFTGVQGFSISWGGTSKFQGPEPAITLDKTSVCLGESVQASGATSTVGTYSTLDWTMPSQATPTTASGVGPVSISFNAPGTYPVILKGTDAQGCINVVNENVTVLAVTPPTYTKTKADPTVCTPANGTITISPTLAGLTYNWVTGPLVSAIPTANKPSGATDERALIGLNTGVYCVDITSPTVAGGATTTTLFSETFESGTSAWTIDNSTGPNQFVVNNSYTGATCAIVSGPTVTVPNVPDEPAGVTAGPKSNFLHIKATTTTGYSCGSGSSNPFPPLNASFDGVTTDQKVTMNTPINTTGKSNIKITFNWLANGEADGDGADDYGAIEYSLNGGTTWTQTGAKLRRQTTWQSDSRTETAWDNQPSLLFRIRWKNDGTKSTDPPLCIDEIKVITSNTAIPSCGSTIQECFTLTSSLSPTINGTLTVCSGATTALTATGGTGTPATTNPWVSSDITKATVDNSGVVTGVSGGTATITYTDNGGCSNSVTVTVTSTPVLTIHDPAAVCSPLTVNVTLPAVTTGSTNAGTLSYYSDAAANTPITNQTAVPSSQIIYIKALNGTCKDIKPVNVTVNTNCACPVVLTTSNPSPVCQPLTVDLTVPAITAGSSSGTTLTYWSDASATIPLSNPSAVNSSNTYYIKSDDGTCNVIKPVIVTINSSPSLIITNPAGICEPGTVDITSPNVTIGSTPGTVLTYWANPLGTASLTLPNALKYSGTYYIKSTFSGCSTIKPVVVDIYKIPVANFTPTPAAVSTLDTKSTMINTSLNASSYNWIFSDGSVSDVTNPVHTFPDIQQSEQLVILIATSPGGCKDTTSKIVTINEELLYYVPNSFTPDGDDFNQTFKPIFTSGFDLKSYHMYIYNRWGELVFESSDTALGWDGNFGGIKVQEGTYTWKIEFKVKSSDARKSIVGSVNVLK